VSRAIGVLGEAARQRVPPALLPFAHRTGFRAGPLRNLPSQRYLSGVLDDIALRRRYMAMRDAILPRDAMRQRAILEQFAGGEARRLSDALGGLITLLAEHPQRDSLHAFASELILRGSTASRAICRNPLVAAMLAGLGVFGMPSCRGSSVM
jgi:hypothetical protein